MTVVGVTGHMDLTPDGVSSVRAALTAEFCAIGAPAGVNVVAVSCLAAGADSIFADVAVELGHPLRVILPSTDYRSAKVKEQDAPTFDRLISAACSVDVMPYEHAGREAYAAANARLLALSDVLLAVWDGRPGADTGSTSALVNEARRAGTTVRVVWPDGAARRSPS